MSETRDQDASVGWASVAPTLVGIAAMVGIAYWCDRAYRRWLDEIHPLAGHRARMVRMSTGYQSKKAGVFEVVQFINDVLDEVNRANSPGDGR
jgi:hypothetical protein